MTQDPTTSEPAATAATPQPLQAIDLLLGEGSAAEQRELRARNQSDPTAMFAMADTVALVEALRQVQVEPSARYAGLLADVVQRAAHRVRPVRSFRGPLVALLAASVTFAVLWWFDPLHQAPAPGPDAPIAQGGGKELAPGPVKATPPTLLDDTVERLRRRLAFESPHLQAAFDESLAGAPSSATQWLESRNALVELQQEHERNADPGVRQAALFDQGNLAAIDLRAQELARTIAARLVQSPERHRIAEHAAAVQALLAAGPGDADRRAAVDLGASWLASALPSLHGTDQVLALAALVEVAAVTGNHRELVAAEGQRFLLAMLEPDGDVWSRHLPEILGPKAAPAAIAEASRMLVRLPGLGGDEGRCHVVRKLMLGQLWDRKSRGDGSAELSVAILFGSGDLLDQHKRTDLELLLRRWSAQSLVPDFVTVRQLLWAVPPGRLRFADLQRELRQLSTVAAPDDLQQLAAFCLCLATNYAAFPGGRGKRAG
ncbi:MAG: hypothetical protein JNK15_02320 [Planctomycetes bacterium]|nr:hypothetical protein [Planctomycetota bacterium]